MGDGWSEGMDADSGNGEVREGEAARRWGRGYGGPELARRWKGWRRAAGRLPELR